MKKSLWVERDDYSWPERNMRPPLGGKREGEMQKWMSTHVADAALIKLSWARLCRVSLAAEVLRKRPGPQLALVMLYVHSCGRR